MRLWRDKPLMSLVDLYTLLTAIYMPVESIVLSQLFDRFITDVRTFLANLGTLHGKSFEIHLVNDCKRIVHNSILPA